MTSEELSAQNEVTSLLLAWSAGDSAALRRLIPKVHERLKRMAGSFLRQERGDHTLQTTALVNEAFLGLVDQDRVQWQDRAHFFAIAGRIMRRILVDHARSKGYQKRGGGWQRLPEAALENLEASPQSTHLIALEDALNSLAKENPKLVKIVEMRFFAGLRAKEMSAVTGLSSTTLNRQWHLARAWLRREMRDGGHRTEILP